MRKTSLWFGVSKYVKEYVVEPRKLPSQYFGKEHLADVAAGHFQ